MRVFMLGHLSELGTQTLHTPNITFDIHQLAVNPSGKLLAVAGTTQVAVVVLPRSGLSRLATGTLECK